MMDGKPDLRPCPFCGGYARLVRCYNGWVPEHPAYMVVCNKCTAQGLKTKEPEIVVKAWNRRAEPENRVLLAAEADGGGNGAFAMGGVTMHESLIQALRFCASGEKFPRLCTEACPLYCAKGNAKTCVACIDSLLRQAADALENNKMGGEK
mgnify:FL=1|nr:MAG TPA: restriction alleviation protein [Caudoviricetes sp.]